MLKQICDLKDCTGCMACANACSHGAITIEVSELGFKYPYILPDKCVECGLCKKVCPSLNVPSLIFPKKCYAVKVKDENRLLSCASGGASTALAMTVMKEGGVVVGCSGDNMTNVRHIIVDKESDLHRLKGSKYVQSEISTTLYKQIHEVLKSDKKVLFIGTGCQIAGLKSFLLKPYDNLITVDLVCHGVPSQKMLNDNIHLYKGIDPNSVRFRIKGSISDGRAIRYGWSSTIHIGNSSKQIFIPSHKDCYMAAFLDHLTFRDCCYRCKYAYSARQSDITICDFWGLGRRTKSCLDSNHGVSAVLITTEKGLKLFESAKSLIDIEVREIQEAVEGNNQLKAPSRLNPLRSKFEELYKSKGFEYAVRHTTMRNNRVRRVILIPEKIIRRLATKFNIKF